MTNSQIEMEGVLQDKTLKPYGKLSKLLGLAHYSGILTDEQMDAFDEELNLLLKGLNRAHITIECRGGFLHCQVVEQFASE